MTLTKLRIPFAKRARPRRSLTTRRNDQAAVFRAFVETLAQLHAASRTDQAALAASRREKA